mmetsp:Transcript_23517/g.49861  ORF Transcript_23517/g.49861 Transcript_23517/m.49861 type:complete len:928 (+) Transcript_23517:233-3016(+)
MALRAFQFNPSIGGFGGESAYSFNFFSPNNHDSNSTAPSSIENSKCAPKKNTKAAMLSASRNSMDGRKEKSCDGRINSNGCDAFAQIVKELVDNAVDACALSDGGASASSVKILKNSPTNGDEIEKIGCYTDKDNEVCKRVRITIAEELFNEMEVLRITVIDTGCGMRNIDECVTVFSSSKNVQNNGMYKTDDVDNTNEERKKGEKKPIKQNGSTRAKESKIENERGNHTAGRYGVGLTLCLLHAQRLVPGSEGIIQSAIASRDEWEKATYVVDTEKDEVLCKNRVHIPKGRKDESGTSISLLVPGGDKARLAWPRLAEYFARFQLSIDLPCSIEVAAPTLSALPLHIYPPAELEKRAVKRIMRQPSLQVNENPGDLIQAGRNSTNFERRYQENEWEGNDGCDDDGYVCDEESDNNFVKQSKSEAVQERERAQEELMKRKELIRNGAKEYEGKDVMIKNVACATQPIRRVSISGQSSPATKKGPLLELSMIVFAPSTFDGGRCDESNDHDSCQGSRAYERIASSDNNPGISVVRMVNGVPLLDGPEAFACGIVQKLASSDATWNSFGLDLSLRKQTEINFDSLTGRRKLIGKDTPTFCIKDSAQVAPFFRDNAHAAFHQRGCYHDESSSDNDFDPETIRWRKRKKGQRSKFILPAHLRLGHILMIVQIRAKPSDLPLPTLSKGRFPMNDKAIDDALENAFTECLKSLQKTSPGLLLNANQLKRLERDAKYVPAIASAISSVVCHSRQRGVHDDSLDIVFGWNNNGNPHARSVNGGKREDSEEDGREKELQAIRLILQRRLRFVVSDELKRAREEEEKERKRTERKEILAERARVQSKKKKILVQSDGTMSDCLQSCTSSESSIQCIQAIEKLSPKKVQRSDSFESEDSSEKSSSENNSVDRGPQSHRRLSTVDTEDTAALTDEDEWF